MAVGRGVRISVNTLSMRLILTRQPFAEYCNFPPGILRGPVAKNPPAMQEMQEIWVQFLGWEDHLDGEMAIHSSYFHLGNPMDSGAWQAGSPWDHRESNTTQNTCRHLLSSCCWNPEFSLSVFKAGL